MKRLAIIGSTYQEIESLVGSLTLSEVKVTSQIQLFFNIDNSLVIACSGIGKVNAAACTQYLLDKYDVTHIVNIGTAASISDSCPASSVVLIDECQFYDFDVSPMGYKMGIIPYMDSSRFKSDEKLLAKLSAGIFQTFNFRPLTLNLASGDRFISNSDFATSIKNMFSVSCIDMECASIAQIAHLNNVPFAAVKYISDKADSKSKFDYLNNMNTSYPDFSNLCLKLIDSL